MKAKIALLTLMLMTVSLARAADSYQCEDRPVSHPITLPEPRGLR